MERSYIKETEQLKKQLQSHLTTFEKSVEWADYSNWLIKAAKIFQENRTPNIPDKEILAKRLAQCLNTALPAKVHGEALAVYETIFQNLMLLKKESNKDNKKYVHQFASDLSLYAIGLFPYFQFASLQVKPQFLKLVQDFIVELQTQLIPCLPGLIACVLPAMEDNDQSVQRQTIKLLDSIQEGVGQKYFYVALWMDILRIPRIRIGGFKYLNKKQKPFKQIEAENVDMESSNYEQKSEDSYYSESRNGSSQIRYKKNSEFKLENNNNNTGHNNEDNNIDTDMQSQNIIIDHDYFQDPIVQLQNTLMEQVNKYQNNKQQIINNQNIKDNIKNIKSEENFYPNKSNLIINAILSVLQDDNQLSRRSGLDYMISHFPIFENILTDIEKQLLIQQCLFQFHLNEYNIMRRINTWLFGVPDVDNKFTVAVNDQGNQLLQFIQIAIVNLFQLPSIDKQIPLKVIQNFYREHDHLIRRTLDGIAFEMIKFMYKNKDDQNIIIPIERLLQSISNHMDIVLNQLSLKLAEAMDQRIEETALEAIELIEFTLSTQQNDENTQIDYSQMSESIQPIIQDILSTFVKIGPKSISLTSFRVPALHLVQVLLQQLTDNNAPITFSEKHKQNIQKFSEYFCSYVLYILEVSEDYGILDYSTKIVIKLNKILASLQEKELKTEIPQWLKGLISCMNSSSTKIQYISVQNIYDLIENPNEFKHFIVKNESTLLQILHCLYYILDDESISSQDIIRLLLHFSQNYQPLFKTYIEKDLQFSQNLESAIRRYSKFFRLTNDFIKENTHQNVGIGIKELLNYLQDDNPLIRYTSRSWLNDNVPYLFRILDPLISDLLEEYQAADYYSISNKKQQFRNQYNVEKVSLFYKLMKPIISILRERLITYCFQEVISKKISDQVSSIHNMVSQLDIQECTYLEVFLFISLKFMQGLPSNSFSNQFQAQNSAINANFCDFLEQIINEILDQEILMKSVNFILENILTCISNLILQNNQVMQVQVLNLFHIILQKLKDYLQTLTSDDKKLVSEILTSQVCFPILLQGLQSSKAYYVNQTYLKTINNAVFFCSLIIQKQSKLSQILSNYVSQIIHSYVDLIKQTKEADYTNDEPLTFQLSRLRGSNQRAFSAIQNIKMIPKHSQSNIYLDLSTTLLLQETTTLPTSFQDQITLFDALNKLINFFLKFKKSQETQNQPHERRRLRSIFNINQNERKESQTAKFGQFEEINRNILDNLSNIIEAFLHCWPLSTSLQNYIQLSSKGILQYNYEAFAVFNKKYQEEQKSDSIKKKDSLRQQIISIMKPIFTSFNVDTMHALFKLYTQHICNDWNTEAEYPIDLYKLLDLIISLDIKLDDFINVLLQSDIILNITNFYNSRITIPKNTFPFNRQIAIHEINVLSFTYIVFSIYPVDDSKVSDSFLSDIWNPANKFFQFNMISFCFNEYQQHNVQIEILKKILIKRVYKNSKHSQSLIWLVESVFMMTQKFSPNQAMTVRSFRKELRRLIKTANKIEFTSVVPQAVVKSTSEAVRRLSEINDFSLIAPMSPTIYQIFLDKPEFIIFQIASIDELKDIGDEQFVLYNQILCYKILSHLSYELLQNIYNCDQRITKITQDFLIDLFKVIEKKSQNKNQMPSIYATQLIHSLLKFSGQLLAKELKKNILELFNGQDFFNCDYQTLRYWKDIIDRISDQGDLFKEFLTKDSLFVNLVSKNHEQGHKLKRLFRLCFIIYSGSVDKYSKKLLDILEALNEIIIDFDDTTPPNIFILILFCLRIIVLRMSLKTLNDQFRIVWPSILTFLFKILNEKRKRSSFNANLVLAALKFIELLSIVQLEEFYFYEWMFAFDFLGVKLEKIKVPSDGMSMIMSSGIVVTPFQFTPRLSYFFSEPYFLDYINSIQENDIQESFEKETRKIIITESTVENEQELNSKVLYLCQYLIDINQKRMAIDYDLLEQVIEQDFIELNKFFFDIK